MSDEDNKILKYISGEKSLKVPFTMNVYLEKQIRVRIILTNPTHKRKLHISLQHILLLHAVHLINQKMNKNIIEEKTV